MIRIINSKMYIFRNHYDSLIKLVIVLLKFTKVLMKNFKATDKDLKII
jgi:hypothetical protein